MSLSILCSLLFHVSLALHGIFWREETSQRLTVTSLAYVEMRIMLARMIWNFDLVLADDSQDWMERQMIYVLWAKGALNVYLKPVVRN